MIFIANTLELNGGTTFLLRACKELNRRGITPIVLVLFGHNSSNVADELSRISRIITLKSLIWRVFAALSIRQFGVFLPLNKGRVCSIFGDNPKSIHVMGIFGLILAKRLSTLLGGVPITIGVYHQNEFLYSAGDGYFVRWAATTLSQTPWENMVFFNEGNRQCYAKQFNVNFLFAPVLPIGIELSGASSDAHSKTREPFLIISVGNLVGFKTYNWHVISCMAEVKYNYPDVRYEIYGEGEALADLREHAIKLGVDNRVKFCGHLDYAKFEQIVSRADVFVGSGTAILESAILGVPSIVGIESIQDPLTYGFISDVVGQGYNEAGLSMPLVTISKCIQQVFNADAQSLQSISLACREKAKVFGVSAMVDGLVASEESAKLQVELTGLELPCLFMSFCWLVGLDLLGIDSRFRLRRNQSWVETNIVGAAH